ncbi:MAG TPA: tail fiber domain-containing protein, partial [Phnomibacter sp.]|nr:tail fiber domain-containing protein [Phnomibacter sp.]
MGSTTTASGIYAVAMGTGSAASGGNSTAMGYFTRAMGTVSTTAGLGVTAKALAAVSIGAYNDDTDNPDADAPAPADCIFQIGIGISNATRSNAITVLRNGNVGLGALDPAYRLDIRGRARIRSGGTGPTSAGIWLNRNDNSALAGFVGVDGNNDLGIYTSNNASWSFLVHITTGNVTVKGNVTANGVTLTSDERLKKDITPLNDAMPLLEKLHGYQYHWKNETTDAGLQTGLLAQEVEKVMPTLVKTDDKGRKSVNYMGLIPYLLEGMKAQQQQIKEMKEVIQAFVQK